MRELKRISAGAPGESNSGETASRSVVFSATVTQLFFEPTRGRRKSGADNFSMQEIEYDAHECGKRLLTSRNERVLWKSLECQTPFREAPLAERFQERTQLICKSSRVSHTSFSRSVFLYPHNHRLSHCSCPRDFAKLGPRIEPACP